MLLSFNTYCYYAKKMSPPSRDKNSVHTVGWLNYTFANAVRAKLAFLSQIH